MRKKAAAGAMRDSRTLGHKNAKAEFIDECYDDSLGEFGDASQQNNTSSAISIPEIGGYQSIVQFQEPQGYFTDLPHKHRSTIDSIPKEKIQEIIKNPDETDQIRLTILAVLILKKYFNDTKDEWAMIAKKALSYLKKHTQKNFNIDEFNTYLI